MYVAPHVVFSCRLHAAGSVQELEKVWGELKKTVAADDRAEKLYLRKKAELHKDLLHARA